MDDHGWVLLSSRHDLVPRWPLQSPSHRSLWRSWIGMRGMAWDERSWWHLETWPFRGKMWQDKQISFLPFPAIFYNPAVNMASREILSKSSNWRFIMFIAGKSTEPMGDSLQNVFHGDRKVLSVDAGETFEEVGRMVIKPSAPGGGSSYWEIPPVQRGGDLSCGYPKLEVPLNHRKSSKTRYFLPSASPDSKLMELCPSRSSFEMLWQVRCRFFRAPAISIGSKPSMKSLAKWDIYVQI